ncbi:MAG: PAS domain S-box protein [Vicinamibacterales bacterium]|nr:PAS domain S-box protein [Vicinamibacterales bacterium]
MAAAPGPWAGEPGWWLAGAFALLALVMTAALVHCGLLRRQLESRTRALAEVEQLYRPLVESIGVIFWKGHPGTLRFTFVSHEAEALLGYPVSRWIEEPDFWVGLMHPDDRAWAPAFCEEAAAKGEPHTFEYRLRAADGRYLWVRDIVSTIAAADGSREAVGVMVNVTDRHEAEAHTHFQASVLEQVDEAILTLDGEGVVTSWNGGAEQLSGVNAVAAIGQRVDHLLQGRLLHPEFEDTARRLHADGERFRAEFSLTSARGEPLLVAATISALRNPHGARVGTLVVAYDIGPIKRVEAELRGRARQQAAVAALGQRALAGIDVRLILDQAAALVAHTLDVPLAAVLEHGAEADEFVLRAAVGWPDEAIDVLAIPARRGSHAALPLASGRPLVVEDLEADDAIGPDPMLDAMDIHGLVAVVIHGSGRPFGILAVYTRERRAFSRDDVHFLQAVANVIGASTDRVQAETERLRLETHMTHVQKLESLGVLAGGIAHDFNNLLVGIMGHAGLALMELPSGSPAAARLHHIETAALRASELTNQMLAYSGRGRFVVQPLDLSRLVEEMGHLLHTAVAKSALVRFQCAASLPLISGDPSQLRQVVMNLITNASDALGAEAGTISLRTGTVHADRTFFAETYLREELPAGEYVFVEVRDSGSGMTRETLARIFDPFFTTKFTGRGLGLAAVLGIVRGHRGAIRIDTQPGEGTSFQVYFPALAAPASAQTAPAAPAALPDWRTDGVALVVDDEEAVREVAGSILEHAGFQVVMAVDGRDGVDQLLAYPGRFAIVLLDMTMPRMNGATALVEMRKIRPDLPVIVTTGYGEQEVVSQVGSLPGTSFIQKPYSPGALIETVRQLLAPGLLPPS